MGNETIEFEDRLYVNPELSMAEQDQFIEKFRNIQSQNQAQINRDTYNLGTPVSSNLGGLTGAEGLWNTQYQRPQVNAAIENLRQVGVQQAVNTAMANQQNAMQNRINQAKRAYYRAQNEAAARDRANANNPNNPNKPDDSKRGGVDVETLLQGKGSGSIQSNTPGTSTILTPEGLTTNEPIFGVYDKDTTKQLWNSNEDKVTDNEKTEVEFWDVNNPLAWLSGLLGLAGSKQQVKKYGN